MSRMKALKYAGGLGFFVAGVVGVSLSLGQLDKWNREQKIYIGKHTSESTIETNFVVRNWSWKSLKIRGVTNSCGCTVTKRTATAILPFRSLSFPVQIDPRNKSGDFQSTVLVEFIDHPPARIVVTGFIFPHNPSVIDFGSFRRDSLPEQIIQLSASDVLNLSVDQLTSANDWIRVNAETDLRERSTIKINVAPTPDIPYGTFRSQIEFTTNSKEISTGEIEIKGYVYQPVELKERTISTGYVSAGTTPEATVNFYSPYQKAIKLREIKGNLPMNISYRAESEPGAASAKIRLVNALEKHGAFTVQCVGIVECDSKTLEIPFEIIGYSFSHDASLEPQD